MFTGEKKVSSIKSLEENLEHCSYTSKGDLRVSGGAGASLSHANRSRVGIPVLVELNQLVWSVTAPVALALEILLGAYLHSAGSTIPLL